MFRWSFAAPAVLILLAALPGCRDTISDSAGGDPVIAPRLPNSLSVAAATDTVLFAVTGTLFTANRSLTTMFTTDSLTVRFAATSVTAGECELFLRTGSSIFYSRKVTAPGTVEESIQGNPTSMACLVTQFSGSLSITVTRR